MTAILLRTLFAVAMMTTISGETVEEVVKRRCQPGQSCYPSLATIMEFKASLTGRLLRETDSGFEDKSRMYNTQEQREPHLIVVAKSEADIVKAVNFAREHNLHVTVKSSGHSYVGRSTWDGALSINLSEMKEMSVNLSATSRNEHGELKVQTGLTWAEIYKELEEHDRVVVGGSAHTVTPGGYTLGGGHSPISRTHGYAVDNVLEIRVVLADGRIATCTRQHTRIEHANGTVEEHKDGDLFWAQLGGGGGSYGIVVHFIYRLHQAPTGMVMMHAWFPLKAKSAVYDVDFTGTLLDMMALTLGKLPRAWGGYILMDNWKRDVIDANGIPAQLTGRMEFFMNKFGKLEESDKDVFSELAAFGKQNYINVTFTNVSTFWEYEKHAQDGPKGRMYITNILAPPSSFTEAFKKFMIEQLLSNWSPIGAFFACTSVLVGGKTTEYPADSTPLHPGYRKAIMSMTCGVVLSDPDKTDPGPPFGHEKFLIEKADAMSAEMRQFGDGMYFNEPAKNNPHWKTDFFSNYSRLQSIKKRYDADNFFVCQHCVTAVRSTETGGAGILQSGVLVAVLFLAALYYQID